VKSVNSRDPERFRVVIDGARKTGVSGIYAGNMTNILVCRISPVVIRIIW
jgi:hypothetical protein